MLPDKIEHCIVFMNYWDVSGVFWSFSKCNIKIPHLPADPSTTVCKIRTKKEHEPRPRRTSCVTDSRHHAMAPPSASPITVVRSPVSGLRRSVYSKYGIGFSHTDTHLATVRDARRRVFYIHESFLLQYQLTGTAISITHLHIYLQLDKYSCKVLHLL